MRDLKVSVVEKLNKARERLRTFHRNSHQLEVIIASSPEGSHCAHCQKELKVGVKFLRCTSTLCDLSGQVTGAFCGQYCHDDWIAAPDFGDPNVYQDEIIPWAVRLEAVAHCLRDINYRVGLAGDCFTQALLKQMFDQLQIPRVDWEGLNEHPELIATIEQQRRFAQEEVFAILTFRGGD